MKVTNVARDFQMIKQATKATNITSARLRINRRRVALQNHLSASPPLGTMTADDGMLGGQTGNTHLS